MYRHRGHRHITVREFDRAIADLEHAARLVEGRPDEMEPDGMPNRHDLPTSTLQTNIWYHLGLAYYLKGDFERALHAYQRCLALAADLPVADPGAKSDDMYVATADWLYMTLRRLGRDAEAAAVLEPISSGMRILENDAYHRRLLMYKGELAPEALLGDDGDALQVATQGYGVGSWYLYNGQPERAREVFEHVVGLGNWPAFGHIAAEAELRRRQRP
jgi:tetratricopeptide (TPR) repeat protein